jgi:hypothetical protein
VNNNFNRGWGGTEGVPGVITYREGLLEFSQEQVKIGGEGIGRGVGVKADQGDGADVVHGGSELPRERGVGLYKGSGNQVREACLDNICVGTEGREGADGEKASGGLGQRGWGFRGGG